MVPGAGAPASRGAACRMAGPALAYRCKLKVPQQSGREAVVVIRMLIWMGRVSGYVNGWQMLRDRARLRKGLGRILGLPLFSPFCWQRQHPDSDKGEFVQQGRAAYLPSPRR